MSRGRVLFCLAALWVPGMLAATAQAQDTILIKNGTIVPVVGKATPNGSLLIQKGRIAAIGTNVNAPPDARVIDAKGMFVYPGMVAPLTSIGLTGYPGAGNDINEIGTSTPHIDPYDALNPEDECVEVTRDRRSHDRADGGRHELPDKRKGHSTEPRRKSARGDVAQAGCPGGVQRRRIA